MILQEYIPGKNILTESVSNSAGGKDLYMKGVCIQGDILNANQRVYPTHEIKNAVNTINEQLQAGYQLCGEGDHPDDLKINVDRVSHMITEMWMEGNDGCGKLKLLPTPLGLIVKTLIESGVRMGVSSRGSGNVNEATGHVSEFEIITIDAVLQPSGPNCYPQPIYESLMNVNGGLRALGIAEEANEDSRVQKYLKEEIVKVINRLKI